MDNGLGLKIYYLYQRKFFANGVEYGIALILK